MKMNNEKKNDDDNDMTMTMHDDYYSHYVFSLHSIRVIDNDRCYYKQNT